MCNQTPRPPGYIFNCKNVVHWSLVPKAFGTSFCIIRIRQRSDKFFNPETNFHGKFMEFIFNGL